MSAIINLSFIGFEETSTYWSFQFVFFVSPAKQKRDICTAFPASSLSSSSSAAAA